MPYFSGQGKLYVASRSAGGDALQFRHLGNVPKLNLALTTDVVDHMEAVSGNRLLDFKLQKAKKCDVTFDLEEFNIDNFAQLLYGTKISTTGATATAEVLPATLAAGDYVRTKYPDITITSFTPAKVEGTDYVMVNKNGVTANTSRTGMFQVLVGGTWTSVTYTYATHAHLPMLNTSYVERWLRFEGLNTADSSKPVLVELYRVITDPVKDFPLISDAVEKFSVTGSALYDTTKSSSAGAGLTDSYLGNFGRIVFLT